MSPNNFAIIIEGDYVDSYIYSGHLVLVDSQYNLTIYKWIELFELTNFGIEPLQKVFLKRLINDSRKPIPKNNINELVIPKKVLEKLKRYTLNIGVWPTDINIFSNKLFIASENGLLRLDLDYISGVLSNELKLFDQICFCVSPNSHDRLAFAAGKEGVLTLIPRTKFYNSNDAKQIISDICLDLDWQSNKLLANTVNGVVEVLYKEMPKKENFSTEQEFFLAVKECKGIPPEISHNTSVRFSWIAGEKTYTLNNDLSIDIDSQEVSARREIDIEGRILRARTAAFGTIVETDDSLFGLINDDVILLTQDPVSWRVFPRAKNYANQLHIIKDDHLSINIIESSGQSDFGFDTENIDLLG